MRKMFRHLGIDNQIKIHRDFPRDKLVNIMRPYLYLYFVSKYSVHGTNKIMISKNLLDNRLNELYLYNPKFGSKRMKRSEKGFIRSINIDHLSFTMNDIINYYKNPNKYNIPNSSARVNLVPIPPNQTEIEIIGRNQYDEEIELSRTIIQETLRNIIEPANRNTNGIEYNSVTNNYQQEQIDIDNNEEENTRNLTIIHPINQTYYNSRTQNRWESLLSSVNSILYNNVDNLNNRLDNNEFVYQFTIDIDTNVQELRRRELEEGEIDEDMEEEVPETGSIS